MFNKCNKIKEIKGINNFNTSKFTNMNSMFGSCYKLQYLNLTNFDTSNINDMAGILADCHGLKEIKGINNFNTTKVINMECMFSACGELEYLNLTSLILQSN